MTFHVIIQTNSKLLSKEVPRTLLFHLLLATSKVEEETFLCIPLFRALTVAATKEAEASLCVARVVEVEAKASISTSKWALGRRRGFLGDWDGTAASTRRSCHLFGSTLLKICHVERDFLIRPVLGTEMRFLETFPFRIDGG